MRAGENFGARTHQCNHCIEMHLALGIHGRDDQFGARLLTNHLPGHDVGVMLQMGDQHLVAGL